MSYSVFQTILSTLFCWLAGFSLLRAGDDTRTPQLGVLTSLHRFVEFLLSYVVVCRLESCLGLLLIFSSFDFRFTAYRADYFRDGMPVGSLPNTHRPREPFRISS